MWVLGIRTESFGRTARALVALVFLTTEPFLQPPPYLFLKLHSLSLSLSLSVCVCVCVCVGICGGQRSILFCFFEEGPLTATQGLLFLRLGWPTSEPQYLPISISPVLGLQMQAVHLTWGTLVGDGTQEIVCSASMSLSE